MQNKCVVFSIPLINIQFYFVFPALNIVLIINVSLVYIEDKIHPIFLDGGSMIVRAWEIPLLIILWVVDCILLELCIECMSIC